ncbi:hypothetical protein AcetOrient_orf04232 [Acetobacter orientalis]|uniref:Uncharacterized protein n=1 Tax=Acetobacter orientalis TaxID=146474 RepID=A0A2Z5ZLC0_9PROT|nr:hypothetical protein AcetOrient_orf04232 [Acetobacter orientalis]
MNKNTLLLKINKLLLKNINIFIWQITVKFFINSEILISS